MFNIPLIAAVAGVLALSSAAKAAETCALPSPPRVISAAGAPHAKGSRLLQVWEFRDAPVWWSGAEPAGYADIRREIADKAGETDPLKLLAQDPWTNNRLVAARAAEWVKPVNCLEMLLVQTQHRRVGMFAQPTEFMAAVLRSPDAQRLRVYYYTINEDGIGSASPITEPAAADTRSGWVVLGVLHNHAFHPGQPAVNGPIAPSKPDAQFHVNFSRSAGLGAAWITNGLHTSRVPASELGLFERDGD
jgi:hypothetical protein